MFLPFALNLSLLFGVLLGPSVLLISLWYRRSLGRPAFVWNRYEMVVLTIIFSVIALIHLIIGVSCFFSYGGYLDPPRFQGVDRNSFFLIGVICFSNIAGMILFYFAARLLLVQLVTSKGIVMNRVLIPITNRMTVLEWNQIVDYYVLSDYPNAVFTFISKSSDMRFERNSIRVPIYLKEEFQNYIDHQIAGMAEREKDSEISGHFLNEN